MGFGNNWNWGNKGSNFNFQKRLLQMYQDCCEIPPPLPPAPPPVVTGTLYFYDFTSFIPTGAVLDIDAGIYGMLQWSFGGGSFGGVLQGIFTAAGETYANGFTTAGAWLLTTEDVSGWTWVDINNPAPPQPFTWSVLEVNPQLKCYKGSQNPVNTVSTVYFVKSQTPYYALDMDVSFGSTAPFDDPGYVAGVQGGLQVGYGSAVTYEQEITGDSVSFVINNIYMPISGITTSSFGTYAVNTVACPATP